MSLKPYAGCRFKVGDAVIYQYSPRGGYGYIFRVDAKVVGFGRGRVKIELKKASGEMTTTFVKEESLLFRSDI